MNNLPIEDERAGKYKTPQNMIDFFQKKELCGKLATDYNGLFYDDGRIEISEENQCTKI
jgi:hypothetical protein